MAAQTTACSHTKIRYNGMYKLPADTNISRTDVLKIAASELIEISPVAHIPIAIIFAPAARNVIALDVDHRTSRCAIPGQNEPIERITTSVTKRAAPPELLKRRMDLTQSPKEIILRSTPENQ